jgi:hypothetical protein
MNFVVSKVSSKRNLPYKTNATDLDILPQELEGPYITNSRMTIVKGTLLDFSFSLAYIPK